MKGSKNKFVVKILKALLCFKYLFIWYGRFQFQTMNSRVSFLQIEGNNMGCCLLVTQLALRGEN